MVGELLGCLLFWIAGSGGGVNTWGRDFSNILVRM